MKLSWLNIARIVLSDFYVVFNANVILILHNTCYWTSSPKNENSVIFYSPPCRWKDGRSSVGCKTFLELHRETTWHNSPNCQIDLKRKYLQPLGSRNLHCSCWTTSILCLVFFYILKQAPIDFSCLGECCNASKHQKMHSGVPKLHEAVGREVEQIIPKF